MPNTTDKVSVLKSDGTNTYYPSYSAARGAIVSGAADHSLIIVWADLNEQIVLLDGTDIWITPGATVNNTSGVTITDVEGGSSKEVHCKIYGDGIIKNTGSNSCIHIDHESSELFIECFKVENVGSSVCVDIKNANTFELTCDRVFSQTGVTIWLGRYNTNTNTLEGFVEYINLNISKIESGTTTTGLTSLITDCNGFIKVNKILNNYLGHALSHRAGEVTARIKKLTSIMHSSGGIATVHTDQGTNEQKLILYFDEIQNLNGPSTNSAIAIHHHQGTGIFIGRKVYSRDGAGIDIYNTKGYISCNEIISENLWGIRLDSNNEKITIDAEYIEGYAAFGCVYGQGDANFQIKNAHLNNKDTSSVSRCIVLEAISSETPSVSLNNVKAVTGNTDDGSIIYMVNFSNISIKNYGLFANKELDSGVTLVIGTLSNFLFVESGDL